MPSKLKRLPNNSYTIIIKFETTKDLEKVMNSEEYKKIYEKLYTDIKEKYSIKKIENFTN